MTETVQSSSKSSISLFQMQSPMNIRKSSLPISRADNLILPKSHDASPVKSLWIETKKRLVSSCSKINNDNLYKIIPKVHSFPNNDLIIVKSLGSCDGSDNSCNTEKSNSTPSIVATLSKVRRLTHVYDHDEILLPGLETSKELLPVSLDCEIVQPPVKVEKDIQEVLVKQATKIGDKSYKLPTKAAAILGADDNLVLQSLHDNSPSTRIQHALFLDHKSNENKHKKISTGDAEPTDAFSKYPKSKKKSGLGSEVKEKIASLWKQGDGQVSGGSLAVHTSYSSYTITTHNSTIPGGLHLKDMERLLRAGKSSVEQIKKWSNSFECLLHDKYGLALFHEFLRSEFSDENIEFWIACEEYRTITTHKKLQSRAEKIYNDFVGVQAAREVNLDSKTRQQTEIDIRNPNTHTFDQAQKRIQALMEKDSYQRFLRSELYGKLLRACDDYHLSQSKPTKDPPPSVKGPTICSLGITAQDLSKLTMTTSKLACMPHGPVVVTSKTSHCEEHLKITSIPTVSPDGIPISTVHPDEPSLPFSKSSLIFTPDYKH